MQRRQSKQALTAIDLFCGAGGLSLGLQWAGFDVLVALDNDPDALKTYEHNLGGHVLNRSIEDVSGTELLELANLDGPCTLVAGGPPCQGFSVQRRGPDLDKRNNLVLEFIRVVLEIRPQFFLMENVAGLMAKRGRPFLKRVMEDASSAGYHCQITKLNAVDYGVPQYRERVFLVGELVENGVTYYQFPEPTVRSPDQRRTVRDALAGLESPPEDGSCHPRWKNHFREKLSPINRERISYVPPGGGREYIPAHLQLQCHRNNPGHRHLDTYGRLSWDEPSVTLTARFDSFTRGRFAHPEEHRTITLREGARIQTFPDNFEFFGSKVAIARQIGNAVPPLLGKILGHSIVAAITKKYRGSDGRRVRRAIQLTLSLSSNPA